MNLMDEKLNRYHCEHIVKLSRNCIYHTRSMKRRREAEIFKLKIKPILKSNRLTDLVASNRLTCLTVLNLLKKYLFRDQNAY